MKSLLAATFLALLLAAPVAARQPTSSITLDQPNPSIGDHITFTIVVPNSAECSADPCLTDVELLCYNFPTPPENATLLYGETKSLRTVRQTGFVLGYDTVGGTPGYGPWPSWTPGTLADCTARVIVRSGKTPVLTSTEFTAIG